MRRPRSPVCTYLCDDADQDAAVSVHGLQPHQLVDEEGVPPTRPRLAVTQRQQQLVAGKHCRLHAATAAAAEQMSGMAQDTRDWRKQRLQHKYEACRPL